MTSNDAETPLFDWDGSTASARTIHDAPTLWGLEEIPIRPTREGDEKMQQPAADTFPDKPAITPGQLVREHLLTLDAWFHGLTPERQEAFRQSLRDADDD